MITPRNLADSSKTHIVTMEIAAKEAGVDLADSPIFRAPKNITIIEAGIIPRGSYTGHADGSAWLIEQGTTAIATKTYTATVGATPPSAGAYDSLGAIVEAAKNVAEGTVLLCSLTNGAGAASPACLLQIEYIINEVL